ncbi:hypothetical protein DFQ28_009660 [Apophysomyces sp. BC1034]|nr:hypothetical protein DFQ30_009909 [Apophysomyces sp. BC1015]KAG0192255.1 hypothetical protein DFQ28_009660 [Apophysomyces sp. BC1034]
MSCDYIRLAAPTYPEMQFCYSPVYDSALSKDQVPFGNTALTSSPRTKHSHYKLRKIGLMNPSIPALADRKTNPGNNESTEDNSGRKPRKQTMPARKLSAPTLCITEASQTPKSRPKFSDDVATTPINKDVLITHRRNNSSTAAFSNGNASDAMTTSLHPSIESTIGPSPRSSLDVEANQGSYPLSQPRSASNLTILQPKTEEKPHSPLQYTKQHTPTLQQKPLQAKSALSALIAEKASSAENPFSEFSFVSGKGEANPIVLSIYLPRPSQGYNIISLVVRRDTVIYDVIGYILYDYVEEKRQPELDEESYDVAQWVLMTVDDGEIEDDIPVLDRGLQINKVFFDQFALCRADAAQVRENEQVRTKLGRSAPNLEEIKKRASMASTPTQDQVTSISIAPDSPMNSTAAMDDFGPLDPGLTSRRQHQTADSSIVAVPVPSSKTRLTKSATPMKFIKNFRIQLMTDETVSATTTIPVYAEMLIGDVLALVSRKRKLDPDEHILTIADSDVVIRNDTTVESLRDVTDLCLIRKGAGLTIPNASKNIWRSPNKKKTEEMHYPPFLSAGSSSATNDGLLSQYKKYVVSRKMPMFVGRRESVLTVDGDYIHIMPPEHKGMFDSVKTTAFHASTIVSCKRSTKPSNFKVVVKKDRDYKTYDFEAESREEAHEICSSIQFLMQINKGAR